MFVNIVKIKQSIYRVIFFSSLILLGGFSSVFGVIESGPYVGLGLGYEFQKSSRIDKDPKVGGAKHPNLLSDNESGVVGSFYLGYLHRFEDSNLFMAIEPFVEMSNTSNNLDHEASGALDKISPSGFSFKHHVSHKFAVRVNKNWSVGASLKLGYVWKETWMLYGLAGLKLSHFNITQKLVSSTQMLSSGSSFTKLVTNVGDPSSANSVKKVLLGGVIGGGVEKKIGKNRLGLEVTYAVYQKSSISYSYSNKKSEQESFSIKPKSLTFMIRYTLPF